MPSVEYMMARCTVRRGLRLSSASGAAPSNPPNASSVNTEPAITPVRPWYDFGVYPVPKTLTVLCPPACTIRNTASTTKTAISNTPRIVPIRADVLMP